MTLLSSFKKGTIASTTKTISIKPLNRIKQLYETPESNVDEQIHEVNIHERIAEAKDRLRELQVKQEEILLATKQQVSTLKSNWDSERNQLVAQAKEEGYADGFKHAEQEVEKAYAKKIEEANELTEEAEKEHFKRIEASTNSIIQLSTRIAEKIIHTHIEEKNDAFYSLVKGAIEELREQPEINIYVPAEQYEFMLLQKNELVELMSGKANVSIYIASHQQCYISHPLGKIDISIDTQLSQMREKLIEIAAESQL